ncbi:MAG: hypothetical protein HY234_03265 [Acidobacteria bacterium]|nr:hypothetical protein [Acidobacteriota bacterium]
MALPEQIPVKYTEEEAEYLSVRPVVRQTFQLAELVDMVLGVTGKDPSRVQQILRTGTVVFNFYRYWWTGFDAGAEELGAVLAQFPDADPGRAFRAEECAAAVLTGKSYEPVSGHVVLPANGIELSRAEAARKRMFRRLFSRKNFWDALMDAARERAPAYLGYSYQRRADLYALEIPPERALAMAREAEKLVPRGVRALTAQIAAAARILFLCPRKS